MATPHGTIVAVSTPAFSATALGTTAFAAFSFTGIVQPLGVQLAVLSAAGVTHPATYRVRQGNLDVVHPTDTRRLMTTDAVSVLWGPNFGSTPDSSFTRASSAFPFQVEILSPATATTLSLIATLFVFVP